MAKPELWNLSVIRYSWLSTGVASPSTSGTVNVQLFAITLFFSSDSEISLTAIQIIERSNCFKEMAYN